MQFLLLPLKHLRKENREINFLKFFLRTNEISKSRRRQESFGEGTSMVVLDSKNEFLGRA